jgi:hypothetical protein
LDWEQEPPRPEQKPRVREQDRRKVVETPRKRLVVERVYKLPVGTLGH